MQPIQLRLTCANQEEATLIATTLLNKRFVACAKFQPVQSNFIWQGKIDTKDEILLVMKSLDKFFDSIEDIVDDLHSYHTFVLMAIPILKINSAALLWLIESLDQTIV
jgi:periplasmic divalent cation tolerance protein